MIEKIQNMICDYIRDKGLVPNTIFMCDSERKELGEEVLGLLYGSPSPQVGGLKEVLGLTIHSTYREISMYITNGDIN